MTSEEARDRIKKALEDSLNVAEGIKSPVKVAGIPHRQAGQDILVTPCPTCHQTFALSGEGKHLCRHCHTWVEVIRES